jgi:DNA-binding NtrC family response regulator
MNAIKERRISRVTPEALAILMAHDYPGNIRELNNILQKAVSISTSGLITPDLLKLNNFSTLYASKIPDSQNNSSIPAGNMPNTNRSLTDVEATHIESLLHQHDGHRAKVAEELRISERTLYRKLKQYNLQYIGKSKS